MELCKAWCRETAHPSYQKNWSENNPSCGQCLVTCLLMQEILGGDIYSCKVMGKSHFILLLNDGELCDLTSSQFSKEKIEYSQLRPRNRKQLLKNTDVSHRYNLLKERYMKTIK